MSDPREHSDERIRREVDDLNRRRAAAPPEQIKQVVNAWARDLAQPGVPDDVAHVAITIRDILSSVGEATMTDQKKKLVLVIHGIRDHGPWMEMVKDRLTASDTFVQPIDYDFYDAPRFLTGWGTAAVMQDVTEKIRDAIAEYRERELIIIAHSFGTFVIAHILLKESDIRCSRAIFCGAVVSKRFRFASIPNRPQIINECSDRDVWPVVAQGFSLWNRYGASGVWGIRRSGITDRFHDFRHSDYLMPKFVDQFWKPYVERAEIVKSPYEVERRNVPWGVSLLSYGWRLVSFSVFLTVLFIVLAWWLLQIAWTGFAWVVIALIVIAWSWLVCRIVVDVRKFHTPTK